MRTKDTLTQPLKGERHKFILERSKMENQVRVAFEKYIDGMIKDSEHRLKTIVNFLQEFGIEPNPENILSYISGNAWGQFSWHHIQLDIEMTLEMEDEFVEIMRRRAGELREVFFRTRYK